MEMDVNRQTRHNGNLMTISARCSNNNSTATIAAAAAATTGTEAATASYSAPPSGCCGILSRLFCVNRHKATHSVAGSECHSSDPFSSQLHCKAATASGQRRRRTPQGNLLRESRQVLQEAIEISMGNSNKSPQTSNKRSSPKREEEQSRQTPGASGAEPVVATAAASISKASADVAPSPARGSVPGILLYPEEGWARTASSSYWTITPCWWQPNRCRIVEFSGTQRRATKAQMLPLEQQGSLLIAGHFGRSTPVASASTAAAASGTVAATPTSAGSGAGATTTAAATTGPRSRSKGCDKSQPARNDEFKLYLTSNISMEDYNMGYCLTGFVERRCQLTNTFQMTHFAVIKRQWPPSPSNLSKS
ncbi:GL20522 [Drosophila persimilis]|uniref:GL20522 n=1 Tax=Drosophila persimilis TaxID=7234 RepID=B4H698_DROPE|nr:GL20522 [Drosophila persimilis]